MPAVQQSVYPWLVAVNRRGALWSHTRAQVTEVKGQWRDGIFVISVNVKGKDFCFFFPSKIIYALPNRLWKESRKLEKKKKSGKLIINIDLSCGRDFAIYEQFHCFHDCLVEVLDVSLCTHVINYSFRETISSLKGERGKHTMFLPTNKAMGAGIKEDFFALFSHSWTHTCTHTHACTHNSDRCRAFKGLKKAWPSQ